MKNLMKFMLVAIIATFFSSAVFGQSVQADLAKKLKAYKLVKIDAAEAKAAVDRNETLKIETTNGVFALALKQVDVFDKNAVAFEWTPKGKKSVPAKGKITTYAGTVVDFSNSVAAISLDGKKVEGFFTAGFTEFAVDKLKNFSPAGRDDEYVVYKTADVIQNPTNDPASCGVTGQRAEVMTRQRLDSDVKQNRDIFRNAGFRKAGSLAQTSPRQFVVGFDFDYPRMGIHNYSISNAQQWLAEAVNYMNGIYVPGLNIQVVLGVQSYWTYPDPYPSNVRHIDLLVYFKDFWEANVQRSLYPRHAAQLLTARPLSDYPSVIGVAFSRTVCNEPQSAYSVADVYGSTVHERNIMAHELGHNLGAGNVHPDQSSDPEAALCIDNENLMDSSVPGTSYPLFCSFSVREINTSLTNGGNCLQ